MSYNLFICFRGFCRNCSLNGGFLWGLNIESQTSGGQISGAPVRAKYLGLVWGPNRLAVLLQSGRQKCNLLPRWTLHTPNIHDWWILSFRQEKIHICLNLFMDILAWFIYGVRVYFHGVSWLWFTSKREAFGCILHRVGANLPIVSCPIFMPLFSDTLLSAAFELILFWIWHIFKYPVFKNLFAKLIFKTFLWHKFCVNSDLSPRRDFNPLFSLGLNFTLIMIIYLGRYRLSSRSY